MDKKALKGLTGVRFWPVLENTLDKYETDDMVTLEGAQSLTKEVTQSDYTIYADDGVYDSGSDYQYTTLTLSVAQLPLAVEAQLSGGTYDETTATYTFKTSDMPIEVALGFAALMLSGNYRMWVYHACKLMSVKVNHNTKGESNEVQSYEMQFRAMQRKADGAIGAIRDSADKSYKWLNTVNDEDFDG